MKGYKPKVSRAFMNSRVSRQTSHGRKALRKTRSARAYYLANGRGRYVKR